MVAAAFGTALAWRSRWFVTSLLLLALSAGLWSTTQWTARQGQLSALIGARHTVTGQITDDPARSPSGQLDFKLTHLVVDGRPVPGTLGVHLYPLQLQRGYRLEAVGPVKAGFGNTVAQMSFPKVVVLSRDQSGLERLRQRFFAGIKAALPEPLASFGLGLLVGIRALIPKDMQAELTLVGLSHLVAVSGYNLTIIVAAADRLLKRFGRGLALVASLWLIAGFLVVTGAGASIVRAACVAVLSLLASFYGRRFHPLVLIMIVAGVTAAYNPGYLTDLGWLLSFLAFFGILVLAPAVEARLGHPKPAVIRLAIESCCAQIITLPLIMYVFGNLSLVAPLSNLVLLPLVPIAMATGLAAGLAGMVLPAFAGWAAWPAMLVLGFMVKLIDGFAALPWAGRQEHLSLAGMVLAYAAIIAVTLVLGRANRRLDHQKRAIVPHTALKTHRSF